MTQKRWKTPVLVGLLLCLTLLVAACGGDDDDKKNNVGQATPTAEAPLNPTLVQGIEIDVSNNPLPRGVMAKDNLTLLASRHFLKDGQVYMAFVVRNDGEAAVQTVKATISFIDVDDLRLETVNFSSPFNNIPPGQLAILQGNFSTSRYYDGISGILHVVEGEYAGLTAFYDAETTANLDIGTAQISGTATNTSSESLVIPVAYFLLYGEDSDDLLGAIPAVMEGGLDEQGYWQSSSTLAYTAAIDVIAGDDMAAIKNVELVVAAYSVQLDS